MSVLGDYLERVGGKLEGGGGGGGTEEKRHAGRWKESEEEGDEGDEGQLFRTQELKWKSSPT